MAQRVGTSYPPNRGCSCITRAFTTKAAQDPKAPIITGQKLPITVQFALNVRATYKIRGTEKADAECLEKLGFNLGFRHDGSGVHRKYVTGGNGYYVDVGCSQLLVDGKIELEQISGGLQALDEGLLVLTGRRELKADIVVLATGHDCMRATLKETLGNKVTDKGG